MKSRLLTAVVALVGFGLGAAAPAAPVSAPGFTFVRAAGPIEEYRLDANGLSVLLAPDHSAPVVTFMVTYRVGSRNEVTGTTGATHILEHMMFKGSENFNDPKGNSVKQYLERVGGAYNATTSYDRTNYFATVGKDSLEGYIAIEADRMHRLWLRDTDRQAEMTVVRNEYERGKNNPEQILVEQVLATAFTALPYHHPTIGWLSDIEHVPTSRLREFYETFYWPDNATVTVAGDFDPVTVLGLIRKYYGVYPHSPAPIPEIYTEEPEQTGPRRVVIRKAGDLGFVLVVHKLPNGRDPDQAAIELLDAILSSGKSSRLYHALVDSGLALSAEADNSLLHDASVHMLDAQLAPNATHEQVERALLAELDRIRTSGVTEAELARVKQQSIAAQAYRRDGTAAIVHELNEWIAIGDWTLYVTMPERIAAVTAADIKRVANQYFAESQSTTGWFIPVQSREEKAP